MGQQIRATVPVKITSGNTSRKWVRRTALVRAVTLAVKELIEAVNRIVDIAVLPTVAVEIIRATQLGARVRTHLAEMTKPVVEKKARTKIWRKCGYAHIGQTVAIKIAKAT